MKSSFRRLVISAGAALLAAGALTRADEVVLTNGDTVSGAVQKVDSGNLYLHSDDLGDIKVPLTDVRTFSTSAPIEIHLTDGTVVDRPVLAAAPGEVAVAGGGLVGGRDIALADIDSINPSPVAWTGTFRLGGTIARGNTFTDTLNAGFDVGLNVQHDIFTLTGEYNYGRQKDLHTGTEDTNIDNWAIEAKDEHDFTKRFYGYVDAVVAKDRIAFLDFRFLPSIGVGYRFFTGPRFTLAGEGGVAYFYENYTNATPRKEEAALKLAYHLTYAINSNVSLFNDLVYYPSLRYGSDFLIDGDAGLRVGLTKRFFADFRAEWTYDARPAISALKNDERYIASLGYTL